MAVVDETPIASSLANGVTTLFPHLFTVLDADDLVVQGTVGGVTTAYTLGVDYSVNGVGASSGSVQFVTAPAAGVIVTRYRDTALERTTDYQNNGDLQARTINLDFDRLWLALQDIFNGGKAPPSTLRVPDGEAIDPFPDAATRASHYAGFDAAGQPTILLPAAGTAAALASELADPSNIAFGDAKLAVKRTFANAAATTQHAVNERRQINVMADCGAVGDGATDDYTAINIGLTAAKLLGADLYFPKPPTSYAYGTTLVLTDGVRLVGEGAPNRWRSAKVPVRLKYTGSGSAVTVAPGAAAGADSIQIVGLEFEGGSSSAGTIGLYLNATAANSYIEGLLIENCSFIDFPENQIRHDGTVFDVTYRHVTAMNPNTAASHGVLIQNGQPSQITFDDCWLMQYTAGMWCVRCLACDDLRFIGGTVAPYNGAAGAHGIYAVGGLFIYGTHIEGPLDTQTGTIGVQYLGSNGAFIAPSLCALFGTGVRIGDGTATAARGWTISGNVGNNNIAAGGVADVNVTAGGLRVGTIADLGFANGSATVVDARRTTDGVAEVMQMHEGRIDWLRSRIAAGSAAAPSLAAADDIDTGWYWTGSAWGFAFGGVQQGQFGDGEVRLRKVFPGTPAGAIQNAAGMFGGTGAPNNADGQNGDFYLRSDGGALTTIYHKRAGSWVGVV